MEQENFNNSDETPNSNAMTETPKSFGQRLYPLDWKDTEVKLAKGRFSHILQRPSAEMLIEREDELDTEIPIAKDGSYGLPDETANEEIDAKYYEQIKISADGYGGREIPTLHKSKAFQGLFQREIYADEDADIFDEEITVFEEIGGGDEPDFTVRHIVRVPDEKDLKKIRQAFNNGRLAPDKRQRQKFVQKSTLKKAMQFYSQYIQTIEGASVGGEKLSDGQLGVFVSFVNPLVQRAVVKALVEKLTGKLLD